MRHFDEIYAIAAKRKGGKNALEALLTSPLSDSKLAAIPHDRWLAASAKCLFQAGFNWKIIEAKWAGFEEAFNGFDPERIVAYTEEDFDRLLADTSIVRNFAKISAVVSNARFILEIAQDNGNVGSFFAQWPNEDYVGLLALIAKRGARLGGITGQRILRSMGRDSFVLTPDVTARLIAEGIIEKQPTAKRDMEAVQQAFNIWEQQSDCGLTQISQCLAYSN